MDFIRELAINNSLFVKNDTIVHKYIDTSLNLIDNLSIDNYYKSKLMISMRSLLILY